MTTPSRHTTTTGPLVAMVHYHLRRGGVTRVIQNAVAAVQHSDVRCVIVTGEPPPDTLDFAAPVVVVADLGYHESGPAPAATALLQTVRHAVRQACSQEPDLWHIHNHSLGKNAAWTQAVRQLTAEQIPVLLQIHDFAEDGRPQNYRALRDACSSADPGKGLEPILYPQSATTHYAVLNRRDFKILRNAGIPAQRLVHLPNAVWTGSETLADLAAPSEVRRILYPTRAIRRKNLGEFLLWSAADDEDRRYGVTLAPESPQEIPAYRQWRKVATELGLPIDFELGLHTSFPDLMRSADVLATTSIAEGFGLAFLEPWLANRPLAGRCLPEITAEFESAGIALPGLYARLTVPADWFDQRTFRDRLHTAYRAARQAYGQPLRPADHDAVWAEAINAGRAEFGHLDEIAQESVIRHIHSSPACRSEIRLPRWLDDVADTGQIAANRQHVESRYGLQQYGQRLISQYEALLTAPSDTSCASLPAGSVLDPFLSASQFRMLRT